MRYVLIDTDVILDFLTTRQPFHYNAKLIFELGFQGKIKLYITPVAINNAYYILRTTNKHKDVIQKIQALSVWTEIIPVDQKIIQQAFSSEFTDFEDAIQHFAALKKRNIEGIVTRNVKDYKKSKLPVLTPDEYLTKFRVL